MSRERYEDFKGAYGKAVWSKWLTSGDFPAYETNVTLTIDSVKKGFDIELDGGQKKAEGLVAFFLPTRVGLKPKQLLLNAGHKRTMRKLFGEVQNWRGPINVYCEEDGAMVKRVLYDTVRIRPTRPAAKSPAALSETVNPGGGPGQLGEPEPKAIDTFRKLGGANIIAKDGLCNTPDPEDGERCTMEVSHDGVCSWKRDPATGDPFPD